MRDENILKKIFLLSLMVSFLFVSHFEVVAAERNKIEVPYIHQRYDTPQGFNGIYACAPVSAVMVLGWYDKLPSGHDLGWYVSNQYTNSEGHTFDEYHKDEMVCGSRPEGKGAWGYIWQDGVSSVKPYLIDYLEKHGLEVSFIKAPDSSEVRSIVTDEIDNGRPVIARMSLPDTEGHYSVIVGYEREGKEIKYLVNDPFGHYSYRDKKPCWGCYNDECPQPVEYSFSELGVGRGYRGLILTKPETEDKIEDKKKVETEDKTKEGKRFDFVQDKGDLIPYSKEKELEKVLGEFHGNDDHLVTLTTLESYDKDLLQKRLVRIHEFLGKEKEKDSKNLLNRIVGGITGAIGSIFGGGKKKCDIMAVVTEEDYWMESINGCDQVFGKWNNKDVKSASKSSNREDLAQEMVYTSLDLLGYEKSSEDILKGDGKDNKQEKDKERQELSCSGAYRFFDSNHKKDSEFEVNVTYLGLTDREEVLGYLKGRGNMYKYADEIYDYGMKYCIDPASGAAVMTHESSKAQSPIFNDCNNGFGLKYYNNPYPECVDHKTFAEFETPYESIRYFYALIREFYVNDNGQFLPWVIACRKGVPNEKAAKPCYVGLGGGRGSWNSDVPQIMKEIRGYNG